MLIQFYKFNASANNKLRFRTINSSFSGFYSILEFHASPAGAQKHRTRASA